MYSYLCVSWNVHEKILAADGEAPHLIMNGDIVALDGPNFG